MQTVNNRVVTRIEANPLLSKTSAELRKKRVGAYCRVSTDSEDQLNSYEAQIAYYTDAIAKNPNWTFVGIYADVYNQRLIPFDTKKAVQTLKITAFEGKKTPVESRYFYSLKL